MRRSTGFHRAARRRGLLPRWSELRVMGLGGVFAGLVAAGAWSVPLSNAPAASSAPAPAVPAPMAPAPAVPAARQVSVTFGFCHTGGGTNCVVDGDTFWMAGDKIRIADIDAPETHPARCAEEARLGGAATQRLRGLLNGGPVTLASAGRDTDRYGRKLRIVLRGGESIGDMLVAEGLARRWTGRRQPWC